MHDQAEVEASGRQQQAIAQPDGVTSGQQSSFQ